MSVTEAVYDYFAFTKFKQDPRYTAILEHASIQQGKECIEIIKSRTPTLLTRINDFKKNDLEGGAITHKFEELGEISSSTLRYLKVASDIQTIFGENLAGNIAEVGVGYGGQLLIYDEIFSFNEYHMFDLTQVLKLASKYLECYILNNCYKAYTVNQHNGHIDYDLSISNYAFSELPSKLQIKYVKKIFSKSRRGYLTMNSGLTNSAFQTDKLSLAELKNLLPNLRLLMRSH
jgi:hypothetical protein